MSVRMLFDPHWLGIGVLISEPEMGVGPRGQYRERTVWLCLFPCIVIEFTRTVWR